ncbi:MAG: hypothetical protein WCL18_09600 [bacterium]
METLLSQPSTLNFSTYIFSYHCFMKRYSLLILSIVIVLTGCTSKSFFSVTFDTFAIKLYDNNKQYSVLPLDTTTTDMKVLTKIKEEQLTGSTGFINSLVIIRTAIQP